MSNSGIDVSTVVSLLVNLLNVTLNALNIFIHVQVFQVFQDIKALTSKNSLKNQL